MENTEVWKPFLYSGFRTLVSVLWLPYSGFRTPFPYSISVLRFRTLVSILQRFPLAPTWDGSPGETTVSECVCTCVIEDRQAFPWHFSQSYQETDYIE